MVEIEPGGHGLGDGDQPALLRPRQPCLAKNVLPGAKYPFRRQIDQPGQPAEDGIGAGAGHLLRDDDRGKAAESRLREPERHFAGHAAHLLQPRIDEAERVEPCCNIVERGDALHVACSQSGNWQLTINRRKRLTTRMPPET